MIRTGFFGLLALSLMAGCASTSRHVPTATPIADNATPLKEFRASGSVALINSASDGHYQKSTDSVITFLSEQLKQRGATVEENSTRRLDLRVTKADKFSAASWVTLAAPEACQVIVRVETGNGYVHEYGEQMAAYFWQKACDKGVTAAVVDILNDQMVRDYLELSSD